VSGLLEGKRILVTGIITDASLAFHVAKAAQEQGATVVLTGFGRMRLVDGSRSGLPGRHRCSSWTSPTSRSWTAWPAGSRAPSTGSTGVLHSIGNAPASCLGEGAFLKAPWEDVASALQVSGTRSSR